MVIKKYRLVDSSFSQGDNTVKCQLIYNSCMGGKLSKLMPIKAENVQAYAI